jgi:hypothetical protein
MKKLVMNIVYKLRGRVRGLGLRLSRYKLQDVGFLIVDDTEKGQGVSIFISQRELESPRTTWIGKSKKGKEMTSFSLTVREWLPKHLEEIHNKVQDKIKGEQK